jgi:hypothetical protein
MATERRRPAKRRKQSAKQKSAEIAIEKRREKAAKLKLAGWSMRDIAAHLKCSLGTVHADIAAVLTRTQDSADEAVRLEREISLARLEVATKGIWPGVESGDAEAVDRLVKLEARRAKILGLDAPTKQEHSGPEGGPIEVGAAASSLESKLDELHKRLTGTGQPSGTPSAEPSGTS